MERSRRIGIILAGVSAIGFAIGLAGLFPRIAAFNKASELASWHSEEIGARSLEPYPGQLVTLTDDVENNQARLRIEYGDQTVLAPVKKPPVQDGPGLALYSEWVKVLVIDRVDRDADGNQQSAPEDRRVVLVSRLTPEGFNAESWGSVRRSDWRFDLYTFTKDGRIEHELRRWPRSGRSEKRLQEEQGNPLRTIEPLEERTWQHFAALHVIPKMQMPKYKFENTALGYRQLGWTLPVTGLCGLLLPLGLIFAVAPKGKNKSPDDRPGS